ncbi:Z1 domain-containing protein [Pseudonocardia sp. RS11V-5]|uniref:Z1 domain-containing protein n=1 Tax=Pseudonocardia terrae TaxID=2905831 RepID=UPI001E4DB7AB|nr:Z1 domain-containing protein [Pseudonocardia terrae]MCE3551332.1 Z1 domain-containing protein [Pseudonocardia terrae]
MAYLAALGSMNDLPKNLFKRAALEAEDYDDGGDVSPESLLAHLETNGPNDPIRQALGPLLAGWDAEQTAEWAVGTDAGSPERRQLTYTRLGFGSALADWATAHYPPHADDTIVITGTQVDPWYFPNRKVGRFYWDAYRRHLRDVKGWAPTPIGELDQATDDIVEQIADPSADKAYGAKGLVVGYVQSGKTANFTGVVAKAIDAGYRNIFILTGTIELLRGQTQRRLDMELIGIENLIGDRTIDEASSDPRFDYANDDDWPKKFLQIGVKPEAAGRPSLVRHTRKAADYQRLFGTATQLRPVKQYQGLPFHHPDNLMRVPAGIFVIKKNRHVLEKLAADLSQVGSALLDIPALIIDDESDQASVNTVDPAKVEKARREGKEVAERTKINEAIAGLLKKMPRAQYLGYTATPFANVFIDPGDTEDLFPRDFVIGLKRPSGYMGASDFSDIGKDFGTTPISQRPIGSSNQRAFVRELMGDEDTKERDDELRRALDIFVLTGAVKLYRLDVDPSLRFAHHTMLIHESVRMAAHGATADKVKELWSTGGYGSPSGLRRLKKLYEADILPVSAARRENGIPTEPGFDDLKKYVGAAVGRISEHANNPVIVVNGDADIQRNQQQLDFDRGSVWRVLVGGTKLSRGFTVEGLTVSYFRRVAGAHDTLTQAGRWFGFRPGYRDLVRVFIGTNEKKGKTRVNLLDAFDAVVQDEEEFRKQLAVYSRRVNGRPQVRPKDIPPLVSQHLFWLKPTANNKMFNTELAEQAEPEFGPVGFPTDHAALRANLTLWECVIQGLTQTVRLLGKTGTFEARLAEVDPKSLWDVLARHIWLPNYGERRVLPWLNFFESALAGLDRFVAVLPQLAPPSPAYKIDGIGDLRMVRRQRRETRGDVLGEPTEPRHRVAAERLVGAAASDDPSLRGYIAPRQGALLCYLVQDQNNPKAPPIMAPRIYLPNSVMPDTGPAVRFRAIDSASDDPVIDVSPSR